MVCLCALFAAVVALVELFGDLLERRETVDAEHDDRGDCDDHGNDGVTERGGGALRVFEALPRPEPVLKNPRAPEVKISCGRQKSDFLAGARGEGAPKKLKFPRAGRARLVKVEFYAGTVRAEPPYARTGV